MRPLPDMRYYVVLPGAAVERLEAEAGELGCEAHDLAARLLAHAIGELESGRTPARQAAPWQGPFPAEGAGWCRSGVPETWKAAEVVEPEGRNRK